MAQDIQIAKWGNSLALRLPRAVARELGVSEGDHLSLELGEGGTVILRSARPSYQLDELVSKINSRNRHQESDWGKPQGQEVW